MRCTSRSRIVTKPNLCLPNHIFGRVVWTFPLLPASAASSSVPPVGRRPYAFAFGSALFLFVITVVVGLRFCCALKIDSAWPRRLFSTTAVWLSAGRCCNLLDLCSNLHGGASLFESRPSRDERKVIRRDRTKLEVT